MSEKKSPQEALSDAISELTWTAPGGRFYSMPTAENVQAALAHDLLEIVERYGLLVWCPR